MSSARASSRPLRLLALLAAATITFVAFAPTAATESTVAGTDAQFAVSTSSFAGQTFTAISLEADTPVARAEVFVPQGYAVDLGQPVGTSIGAAAAFVSDIGGTSAPEIAQGELVVDDPSSSVADDTAQACAPGVHAAVWRADLSVLGQTFSLRMFLDPVAGGGAGPSYVLRMCPIWPPSAALPKGLSAVGVSFFAQGVVRGPTVPADYTWSTIVTPTLLASAAPDPPDAYELRSVVPYPHTLTLRTRYQAKTKSVVLSGKLMAHGQPEAGVEVSFGSVTDASTDDGSFFGPATTNASGAFSIRRRVDRSTQFTASAEPQDRPCSGPSSAPAGCLGETVSPPDDATAVVLVRRATDPTLRARAHDQALARRVNVKLTDLPSGWQSLETLPITPCDGFRPNLRDLTVRGEASSPAFLSANLDGLAVSRAAIYDSEAQARVAFGREARLAAAQCFADETQGSGVNVLRVGPQSFPRLGNQTRAFRVVTLDAQGMEVLDLVSFRRGRAVVHMAFVGIGGPLSIERAVARQVAARARAG